MVRKDIPMKPLSGSVRELGSQPAEAARTSTDFHRLSSRSSRSVRELGSQSTGDARDNTTGLYHLSGSRSVRELGSQSTGDARDNTTGLYHLPGSRSVRELGSRPTSVVEKSKIIDFHRPSSRSQSVRELASQPTGEASQQRDLPIQSSDVEEIERRPESASERSSIVVVSDRGSLANQLVSDDIQKLLTRLNIVPGGEDGEYYTRNLERAQSIKDNLRKIEEIKGLIETLKDGLVDDSRLGFLSRMYSPPGYRIGEQTSVWESDLQIEKLDSRIVSLKALAAERSTFLGKALTEGHATLIEGHKKAIRFNDWLAGTLVNPLAMVALALGIAAVGSISSSVIADRVLISAVISNILATAVEVWLFAEVGFPGSAIANGIQWTGMNSGAYLVQKAIENHEQGSYNNSTIHLSHNFTASEFGGLLAEPFGNLTIGNSTIDKLLMGRLDELTEYGPITIKLTENV
jgi:hypothetical protein